MQRVCQQLDGAFTLVAIDARTPTGWSPPAATRPLVVGLGEGENFLGSDVAAFIEHTREALELGQDQIVTITARRGRRSPTSTATRSRPTRFHVDWDLSAAEKDGYDWFMRKEIFEQPRAVADSLIGRRGADGRLQLDEMRLADDELRDVDKIIIIACGTSFYAGMVAKYAIEHWTRTPVEVELASEFRYRDPIIDATTLVVAISQSGETADTLQAIRHARDAAREGARDLQHQRLHDPARVRRGDLHPRRPGDRRRVDQGVPDPARRLLPARALPRPGQGHPVRRRDRRDHGAARGDARPHRDGARTAPTPVYELAREHAGARSVLFLGRHAGYPVALEGALKLKELAYLHAEGFAAGELKHGPIALVEEGLPVLCVVPPRGRDYLHDKMLSGIQEVRARGARTICLAEEGDDVDRAVRRRADPAARRCRCCSSRWSRSSRCSCSPASSRRRWATTSTSPATSPSPSRSSRPGTGDHRGRHRRVRHRPVRGVAAAYPGARASGSSPPPSATLRAGLAGRPVRGQGGARQGARRARAAWTGTTPRWSPRRPAGPGFVIRGTVLAQADRLGVRPCTSR